MMSNTSNPIISSLLGCNNNVLVGMNDYALFNITSYSVKLQQKEEKTAFQQVTEILINIMKNMVSALLFKKIIYQLAFVVSLTHSLHYFVLQKIAHMAQQYTKVTKLNENGQYLSKYHNNPYGKMEYVVIEDFVQLQTRDDAFSCMKTKERKRPPTKKQLCLEHVPAAIVVTSTVHKLQGKSCLLVALICISDEISFCHITKK